MNKWKQRNFFGREKIELWNGNKRRKYRTTHFYDSLPYPASRINSNVPLIGLAATFLTKAAKNSRASYAEKTKDVLPHADAKASIVSNAVAVNQPFTSARPADPSTHAPSNPKKPLKTGNGLIPRIGTTQGDLQRTAGMDARSPFPRLDEKPPATEIPPSGRGSSLDSSPGLWAWKRPQ